MSREGGKKHFCTLDISQDTEDHIKRRFKFASFKSSKDKQGIPCSIGYKIIILRIKK